MAQETKEFHHAPWRPDNSAERALCESLTSSLKGQEGVIELLVFGSIARRSTTGFSDVDAVLVIEDRIATHIGRLRALRRRVLQCERAIQAFQPMQHHGLLVATPRLLADASGALELPAEALGETQQLLGAHIQMSFAVPSRRPETRFRAMCDRLVAIRRWPSHPWEAHLLVSMSELLPALYLQMVGRPCAKHESFQRLRPEFSDAWACYDVLFEVRERWPRRRHAELRLWARTTRNPWTAAALWRKVPAPLPRQVGGLLDGECLEQLQGLVGEMVEKVERRNPL